MAQQGIREYDAKHAWYNFLSKPYIAALVDSKGSLDLIVSTLEGLAKEHAITHWVVKPDQLFGKRGKYGLVGVKLTPNEVYERILQHRNKETAIDDKVGILDTFIVEPFLPHTDEWYIACKTTRDGVEVLFSEVGGIDIEENRDHVKSTVIDPLHGCNQDELADILGVSDAEVIKFIEEYYNFFITHGGAYLESNPIVRDETGTIVVLDMVMKVDTCESWKQKHNWSKFTRVKGFGTVTHPFENIIEDADARTGASLKCSILNTEGSIALLLGGGGASVVTMDKLHELGLLSQVVNYGELSGNPSYDDNRLYTEGLLEILLSSSAEKKVLCLIGGIANFTRIDVLCKAFVDVLRDHVEKLKENNVSIFVRRGGVQDTKGLALVETFCASEGLSCYVADGEVYLTDAIEHISSFL